MSKDKQLKPLSKEFVISDPKDVKRFHKEMDKAMSKETELLIEIRSYLKEQIREYKHGSNAYNVLRKLETSIPNIINSHAQQSPVTDEEIESESKRLAKVLFDTTGGTQREAFETNFTKGAKWHRDLQPKTDDWVSVSERLPKKSGRYNVFDGDNVIIWRFKYGRFRNKFITHWQDLPQPPNNKNR